jgi:hypothetical protein
MTATKTNGTDQQTRPTLAHQIDRLDAILDGLSEGLNGAVADAVSKAIESTVQQAVAQAVHEAVQAVLTEVLTNRDLQQRLHEVAQEAAPPPPPAPTADSARRQGPLGRAWEATTPWVKQAIRSALAAGVLIGGAVAAGFFAARGWAYRAARAAWAWGTGLICGAVSALGSLLPVAWCT